MSRILGFVLIMILSALPGRDAIAGVTFCSDGQSYGSHLCATVTPGGGSDDSGLFNDPSTGAIAGVARRGVITVEGTVLLQHPIKIGFEGTPKPITIKAGANGGTLKANGTMDGVSNIPMVIVRDCGRGMGTAAEVWTPDGDDNMVRFEGTSTHPLNFDGNGRSYAVRGLRFEGWNSDVLLKYLTFQNIAGTAVEACPTDEKRYDASTASKWSDAGTYSHAIQESDFENVTITNCGASGAPSFIVARNNGSDTNRAHNNLRVKTMAITQPNGTNALLIKSSQTHSSQADIHGLQFHELSITGQASADLISIEVDSSQNSVVQVVRFSGTTLSSIPSGYCGVRVGAKVPLDWRGGSIGSSYSVYGFRLETIMDCLIRDVTLSGSASLAYIASQPNGGAIRFRNTPTSYSCAYGDCHDEVNYQSQ